MCSLKDISMLGEKFFFLLRLVLEKPLYCQHLIDSISVKTILTTENLLLSK